MKRFILMARIRFQCTLQVQGLFHRHMTLKKWMTTLLFSVISSQETSLSLYMLESLMKETVPFPLSHGSETLTK